MMAGNGTTSKGVPGYAEMNSILPVNHGTIFGVVGYPNPTDGVNQAWFNADAGGAGNKIKLYKGATNNHTWYRLASGVLDTEVQAASVGVGGMGMAFSHWDDANTYYWNGAGVGTDTGIGDYVGNVNPLYLVFFAATTTPGEVTTASIAHVIFYDQPKPPPSN